MTASELAFLGLGLLLGAATGAALIVTLGSRLPRREIRVTVTPGVVPRRSETLSQDAFVTQAGEPARGGPGDRRWYRDDPARATVPDPDHPSPAPLPTPSMPFGFAVGPAAGGPMDRPADRTIVPTGPGRGRIARPATGSPRPQVSTTVPIGSAGAAAIAIEVSADPALEQLEQASRRVTRAPALERILRGEHRAMVEVLDAVAGEDGARRREWELLLGGLVDALAEMAVRESVIDFPMGTPFWDTFTVEQCRRIVGALATMGYVYDGHDGWVDNRIPAYRDLSQALADVGIDPRRIRAWPTSSDIAQLFVGARPAPEELLAAAGPAYRAQDVRELLAERQDRLGDLWLAWEAVRPSLFGEADAGPRVT